MTAKQKSYLKSFLKIAFVVALLYFLSQRGFLSLQQTRRAFSEWRISGLGVAAMFMTSFMGAIRWQLLLRAQGIRMGLGRTTQLTFIGNFFNIALPGAVSGDFVKAFYVAKDLGGQRARAFGSILFDRVAGLSALVLVSAVALLAGLGEFTHTALFTGTRFFVVSAAICVIIFYAYLFLVREHHDPVLILLRKLEAEFKKAGSLTRIYEGLRHYHNHRATVLQVLVISVVVHLMVGWACLQYAVALGETDLALLALYVIIPLGILVTSVPVAPAGVGTGHAAFLFLFGLLGSKRGADVYTLFALVNIALGAIGGIVYLRFRTHEQPAPIAAAQT